jgi:drug/metabolite transporter (DMT)-like permease
MPGVVYVLCALTCLGCATLLLRSYARTRTRLLLWSGLCFAGLAGNNVFLFVDLVVLPQIDLSVPRDLTTLGSLALLVYGLVWESRE